MKEEGQNAAVETKNSADRKIGGKTRDIDKTSARYTLSCRGLPLQPFRATKMVGMVGLEPMTSCMSSMRSNQLSYTPVTAYISYHFSMPFVKQKYGTLAIFLFIDRVCRAPLAAAGRVIGATVHLRSVQSRRRTLQRGWQVRAGAISQGRSSPETRLLQGRYTLNTA